MIGGCRSLVASPSQCGEVPNPFGSGIGGKYELVSADPMDDDAELNGGDIAFL